MYSRTKPMCVGWISRIAFEKPVTFG
jgi:hypothetical protein